MYGRRVILFIIIFTLTLLPNITVAQSQTLYNTNSIQSTPIFTLYGSKTIRVNASSGGSVSVNAPDGTQITTKINPNTYVNIGKNVILSSYNFTLATFTIKNTTSPVPNTILQYSFAFEINGQINSLDAFVNATGGSTSLTTTTKHNVNWTTLTYLGGTFNGTTYTGGKYSYNPHGDYWSYNTTSGTMTNTRFRGLYMRVFVITKNLPLLTLYSSKTIRVNASSGGSVSVNAPDGTQITTKINPGTYVDVANTLLSSYNFTLATFTIKNLPVYADLVPQYGFAFEVNNQINPYINFVNSTGGNKPLITIANHNANWTTLTFSGGLFNGTAYISGIYIPNLFNVWSYNTTTSTITNTRFISSTIHVFMYSKNTTLSSSQTTIPQVLYTFNSLKIYAIMALIISVIIIVFFLLKKRKKLIY